MYFSLGEGSLKAEQEKVKLYTIHLEEIHWLAGIGECTTYGEGETFITFADCVAATQYEMFKPVLNCRMPWMAGPGQNYDLCEGKVNVSKGNFTKFRAMLNNFFVGQKYNVYDYSKSCPKPCTEVQVTSKPATTVEIPGLVGIGLYFKASAKVTEEMMAYGLVDLAVEVGSSLGLWIGLSALGIFDIAMAVGHAIKKII